MNERLTTAFLTAKSVILSQKLASRVKTAFKARVVGAPLGQITAAAAMLSFQGTCAGEKTKQNKNKTDPHPKKKQPIITHHETAFCAS